MRDVLENDAKAISARQTDVMASHGLYEPPQAGEALSRILYEVWAPPEDEPETDLAYCLMISLGFDFWFGHVGETRETLVLGIDLGEQWAAVAWDGIHEIVTYHASSAEFLSHAYRTADGAWSASIMDRIMQE